MYDLPRVTLRLLVIVGGKPGSGKSMLAQRLADALWLPLVSKDAIRQGMIETHANAADAAARSVDGPTSVAVFYDTIAFLLRAGVSLIAEHSFRRGMSEPDLRPLCRLARLIDIHCTTSIAEAQRRFSEELRRQRPGPDSRSDADHIVEQMKQGIFDWATFDPLDLDVPRLRMATTANYQPGLDEIVSFIRSTGTGGPDRGC